MKQKSEPAEAGEGDKMENNNQLKVIPSATPTTEVMRSRVIPSQSSEQQKPNATDSLSEIPSEVLNSFKDSRQNSKKAISASTESTKRVQEQNQKVIDMCDRELKRKDLCLFRSVLSAHRGGGADRASCLPYHCRNFRTYSGNHSAGHRHPHCR